jgi:adenylate kinase
MLNLVISGAPGCGKGTQSDLIIEKYHLKHFSTGELLRKEIEMGTTLGIEAHDYIIKGNLVPDEMIIDIITHAINSLCKECPGIIFDGFPRTVEQAEALENLMNGLGIPVSAMIELKVPDRDLMNRLLIRGETSGRTDDNLETIKKRLDVFKSKTAPVTDYYASLGKYHSIDGVGTLEEVFERICAVLDTEML